MPKVLMIIIVVVVVVVVVVAVIVFCFSNWLIKLLLCGFSLDYVKIVSFLCFSYFHCQIWSLLESSNWHHVMAVEFVKQEWSVSVAEVVSCALHADILYYQIYQSSDLLISFCQLMCNPIALFKKSFVSLLLIQVYIQAVAEREILPPPLKSPKYWYAGGLVEILAKYLVLVSTVLVSTFVPALQRAHGLAVSA